MKSEKPIKRTSHMPNANVSEYKIGNTTYLVETHFCCESSETLDDIIKRLIKRGITKTGHIA